MFGSMTDHRKLTGVALLSAISVGYFVYVFHANTDLADGKYVLFMDEELVFSGVRKILHPPSAEDFVKNVVDGNDHRYGRILWTTSALASFLPERWFGETGQIIATRMIQATILWLAYLVFVTTFLRRWATRAVALLLLACLPSTAYYATMPKPEPLQLLFLALFLRPALSRRFVFGAYWFWLGAAFGAKISALPVVALSFVLALALPWIDLRGLRGSRDESAGRFALRPALGRFFSRAKAHVLQRAPWVELAKSGGVFYAGLCFSVPILAYARHKQWLRWTFFKMGHPYDDPAVNWLTWMKFTLYDWLDVPPSLLLALGAMALGLAVFIVAICLREDQDESPLWRHRLWESLAIGLFGAGMILAVAVRADRVWEFYLHPGAVLGVMGLVGVAEAGVCLWSSGGPSASRRAAASGAWALLAGLVLTALVYRMPAAHADFLQLARRSQSPEHQRMLGEYHSLVRDLGQLSELLDRRLKVSYSARLLWPASTDRYEIAMHWAIFQGWDAQFDVVVAYRHEMWVPGGSIPPLGSTTHQKAMAARSQFARRVGSDAADESDRSRYVPVKNECDQVFLLVRRDIYQQLGSRLQLARDESFLPADATTRVSNLPEGAGRARR
jgi:hypothetical protein